MKPLSKIYQSGEMSSTSKLYLREDRSGLFEILRILGEDIREADCYEQRVSLTGRYSHMVFKMVYGFFCQNHRVEKQCFTVSQIGFNNSSVSKDKSLPRICIKSNQHTIEKALFFNPDSDEWESKLHGSSLLKTISLKIDFRIHTPSESNVIRTMSEVARMFYDQCHCDAEFKFEGNKKIGAHILILSAGSPVFAAMFQSNMLESRTHQVTIADIKIEVFRQLLIYLYTGLAPMLGEDMTQELYEAADKYNVETLQDDCVDALLNSLSSDNCLNVLVWSHAHSIGKLFKSAMIVAVQCFHVLCFQQEWSDFMKNFPDLCLQLLQRMASSHAVPLEH